MKKLIYLIPYLLMSCFCNFAVADSFYRFGVFHCSAQGFELKHFGTYESDEKLPGPASYKADVMYDKLSREIKIKAGEFTYFALEPQKSAKVSVSCKAQKNLWTLEFEIYSPSASGNCGGNPGAQLKLIKNGKVAIRGTGFAICEGPQYQSVDEMVLANGKIEMKCRNPIESLVTPPIEELKDIKCPEFEVK
jgi:hypothetical protein